jgi:spermidine synthase
MIGVKILEEVKSLVNGKIRVVRSLGFGTYLQAGGITQSGGVVEEIWQKTLRQVKKQKTEIKNCLILGLGGGTAAKLVRKYWPEAKITGVEIDLVMVELGRKYLGLETSRVKIIIADAFGFDSSGYDLVIVDVYRGDEFPKKFESEKFLWKLTKNKLAIFNRLYYGEKRSEAIKFGERLEKIFPKVEYFYPQANLMFLCYN